MRLLAILVVVLLIVAPSVQAAEKYLDNDLTNKLKRGAINVVSAPLEMPHKIKEHWQESSSHPIEKGVFLVGGVVKGTAYMLGRFGSGLWDMLTFNLDIPKGFEPLMKPDYVCEKNK